MNLTGRQRRLARQRIRTGLAKSWREASDYVLAFHPDQSDDQNLETQLARSLQKREGLKKVIA